MILHFHRETLVRGIERWAFRDRPGFQNAIEFEAEVVVQAGSPMLLHNKAVTGFLFELGGRLGCRIETPFSLIFLKSHGRHCSQTFGIAAME